MAKLPEKAQKAKPSPSDADDRDEVAQEIANRIGNLVSAGQRDKVVAQMVALVVEERFSGPIAHPKHLREYDEICPGAADRIIGMAERNLKHNQDAQMQVLKGEITDIREGRLYGFVALMVLAGGAVFSVYEHETMMAGLFLGTGVLGIIRQLIRGRQDNSKDN